MTKQELQSENADLERRINDLEHRLQIIQSKLDGVDDTVTRHLLKEI